MPQKGKETKGDVFSKANREKYFNETSQSLNALLDDVFGEDTNELLSAFPKGCKRSQIKVESTSVSMTYLDGAEEAFIEVSIHITYKGSELGEYQSIYNMAGELEDESFFLE